jgi:hypothetical protein
MASPLINYDAYTTLPANPTPEQLARWLEDGRTVLRDAADPLRLYDAVAQGRATPEQRRRLLGRLIDGAKAQLGGLAHWLADGVTRGTATLAAWYRKFSDIAATHNYAGVMTAVGTIDPSPADRGAADNAIRKQLGFLARFREQLRIGAQPLYLPRLGPADAERVAHGRFVARSEMYGDALYGVAEDVMRQKMMREGYSHERRVLGGKHHCATCKDQAALGWQPINTLKSIGDSPCSTNCRCSFKFKHDDSLNIQSPGPGKRP